MTSEHPHEGTGEAPGGGEHSAGGEHGHEHGGGPGIKGKLTRRVGPLPVWGWGVVVAGVVGLALYLRSHSSAGAGGDSSGYPGDSGGGAAGAPAPDAMPVPVGSGAGTSEPVGALGNAGPASSFPGQGGFARDPLPLFPSAASVPFPESGSRITQIAPNRAVVDFVSVMNRNPPDSGDQAAQVPAASSAPQWYGTTPGDYSDAAMMQRIEESRAAGSGAGGSLTPGG